MDDRFRLKFHMFCVFNLSDFIVFCSGFQLQVRHVASRGGVTSAFQIGYSQWQRWLEDLLLEFSLHACSTGAAVNSTFLYLLMHCHGRIQYQKNAAILCGFTLGQKK